MKISKRSFTEREVKAVAVTLVKTITSLHLCYIYHGNINLQSLFTKHIKKNDSLYLKLGGFENAHELQFSHD